MSKKSEGKPGKDGRIPLTIRLKPETWKALEKKAQGGISKNIWVQEMLDQYLEKVEFRLQEAQIPWDSVERRKGERRKLGS